MRRPGIEPGSTAWKAAMLTIIPPTLPYHSNAWLSTQLVRVLNVKNKKYQKCHCRDQDSNLGYCGHNAGS